MKVKKFRKNVLRLEKNCYFCSPKFGKYPSKEQEENKEQQVFER